ncbi:MAG TPA: membrane protein insertase YidC, partial [Candidatus Omnitrophota bacterium]|nr:membrane protein insertase YidC [Candidatus Omnitrophota bacterium]
MNEQRNLILAIVLSAAILFGFQYFFPTTPTPRTDVAQGPVAGAPPVPQGGDAAAPVAAAKPSPAESRAAAVGASRRIPVKTPALHGSVNLKGAVIDDLTLVRYHETPDPSSPEITLLSPAGSPQAYFAEFGWVPADAAVKTPRPDSMWTPAAGSPAELGAGGSLSLTWDNGEGLRFVRTYSVDENYMFSVNQRVENYGNKPVTLHPYGLVARGGTPKTEGMYILHEGPLGVLDGTLKEISYEDLAKDGQVRDKTTGGWLGITDKYWLTALVPDQKEEVTGRFVHQRLETGERYQVDFTGAPRVVQPGASAEAGSHFFAGAKQVALLDAYGDKLGIERFSYAIDFGWFWFLTKPFFYLLQMLHAMMGNMGLAILGITVILKALMFPLANKSYVAMTKMKKLQPQVQALQARYGDDKMRLQQEMMAIYKREKVNPVSGCLPILIQIPVFFALYKVLFVTIEMRHAPFVGWIKDLSAPDPTTIFNLFGIIPWDPP